MRLISLKFKKKISKLPNNTPNIENVTYVNIDFKHHSLKERLLDAGFDQRKPTIYTLEGVSQYIPRKALNSTLNEVATLNSNSNSKIFISYVNKLLKKILRPVLVKAIQNLKKQLTLLLSQPPK